MTFLDQIKSLTSVATVKEMSAYIIDYPDNIVKLLDFSNSKDKRTSVYSSWVLSHAAEFKTDLFNEVQFFKLLDAIKNCKFNTVKRNLLKVCQFQNVPEKYANDTLDITFNILCDTTNEVAVRAYSISILENCLKWMPELENEIIFILEKELEFASPAFKSRAVKFLKHSNKKRRTGF